MPLTIRVENSAAYAGAVLDPASAVDDVIVTIPGFLGAFDAADWSGSGTWLPRLGTGASILPAAAGTTPVKAVRDGADVMRFAAGSKAFVNDYGGSSITFSGLTYASRAYFSDGAVNFQKVFDLGTPEFFFRSTTPSKVWQLGNLGTSQNQTIAEPVLGWHQFTFSKHGTDAAMLEADGAAPVIIAAAGAAMANNTVVIGDAGNATSAVQDVRRIILCNGGVLTTDQRAAISTWLSL